MTATTKKPSRLIQEMMATAEDLRDIGALGDEAYRKITMRDLNRAEVVELRPLSGEEIRAMREQAHMSQAVFAKHLNLTVGYVSQLEREVKRPTGPALALLDVIRRKGIEAIL